MQLPFYADRTATDVWLYADRAATDVWRNPTLSLLKVTFNIFEKFSKL